MRNDSFATRFTAAIVLATPWILLAIGYSQADSSVKPHGVGPFVFVLALATFATGALAYVTRDKAPAGSEGMGEQVVELLERARTAEARATFAEQQLASTGYGSFAVQTSNLANIESELARMRGGSSGHAVLWGAVLFVTGSLAAGYFAGYAPLQDRIDAQRRLAQTKDDEHKRALTALRSRFDSERSALEAQLRAAQPPHTDAAPEPTAAAAPAAPAATTDAKPVPPPAADKPEPAPAAKVNAPEAKKANAQKEAVAAQAEGSKPEAKLAQAKQPEANTAKTAGPADTRTAESRAPAKAKAAANAVHARAANTHAARPAHKNKIPARVAAAKPAPAKPGTTAAKTTAAKSHYDEETLDDDPIGGL
jgi:hypothetical protein